MGNLENCPNRQFIVIFVLTLIVLTYNFARFRKAHNKTKNEDVSLNKTDLTRKKSFDSIYRKTKFGKYLQIKENANSILRKTDKNCFFLSLASQL